MKDLARIALSSHRKDSGASAAHRFTTIFTIGGSSKEPSSVRLDGFRCRPGTKTSNKTKSKVFSRH